MVGWCGQVLEKGFARRFSGDRNMFQGRAWEKNPFWEVGNPFREGLQPLLRGGQPLLGRASTPSEKWSTPSERWSTPSGQFVAVVQVYKNIHPAWLCAGRGELTGGFMD